MALKQTLASIVLGGALALGLVGKANSASTLYDDFSSATLNSAKWDVRQDYEGWQFTDEYGVDVVNQNFHTQQNNQDNAGTFLVPKHQFLAGETFEYDIFYNSGSGNRVSMLLADRNRMGIVGSWNSEFTGVPSTTPYHIKMTFGDGFIEQTISNMGGLLISRQDSTSYDEVYIGMRTGDNGTAHFDYDNFYIGVIPEPSTLGLFGLGALGLTMLRRGKNDNMLFV